MPTAALPSLYTYRAKRRIVVAADDVRGTGDFVPEAADWPENILRNHIELGWIERIVNPELVALLEKQSAPSTATSAGAPGSTLTFNPSVVASTSGSVPTVAEGSGAALTATIADLPGLDDFGAALAVEAKRQLQAQAARRPTGARGRRRA